MRFAVFSAHTYDKESFAAHAPQFGLEPVYFPHHLNRNTALSATGFDTVCTFVQDELDADTLATLRRVGVRCIVLRCAGFNQVDVRAALRLGIAIGRVPAYSPESVAEHAVALMLSLARRIPRAYNRVREGNFSLEGLTGMCLHGKTVGIVGLGKIGLATARILEGFGCRLLGYDLYPQDPAKMGKLTQAPLETLLRESDILSLHCPLTRETHHLIDARSLERMKRGAMIINTSRGGVIETPALIEALKAEHIGSVGLDVYEEETELFFEDLSEKVLQDGVFARLVSFPNVIVTGHQGFFTREALQAIAEVTCQNIEAFSKRGACLYPVTEAQLG
jgi:D-lactate dehydrogenase